VDGGKGPGDHPAPLVARAEFPPDWRVVLVAPAGGTSWSGERERRAFAESRRVADPTLTGRLCRLLLLGLLPALAERDAVAFGEALHEFNARAGEPFAAAQGGTYSSPAVGAAVRALRGCGAWGVGQSSWGPTVFAVAESEDAAEDLARRVGDVGAVTVTAARPAAEVVDG
jgi:beta-RFAP synthase